MHDGRENSKVPCHLVCEQVGLLLGALSNVVDDERHPVRIASFTYDHHMRQGTGHSAWAEIAIRTSAITAFIVDLP